MPTPMDDGIKARRRERPATPRFPALNPSLACGIPNVEQFMNINTLQVFDPAMCCSTGVCGPQVETRLVQFAADLDWLRSQGVIVKRHNLSQSAAAFVANGAVTALLVEKGEAALPVILVNGRVESTGVYPGRSSLAVWFKLQSVADPVPSKGTCCGDRSC